MNSKSMKAIINGKIILNNEIIENKIIIFDRKIIGIFDEIPMEYLENIEIVDAKNKYVSPGLIDIHVHGNSGFDFMDASFFALKRIEKYMVSRGVTGYLATTMTMSPKKIYKTLDILQNRIKNNYISEDGAKILGVHLEGPFLSEKFKGAQDEKYILSPSYSFIEKYTDIIKIITYAPEKDVDLNFTKYITSNTDIVLSMGHTNATYDEACNAIKNGTKNATHLFNAMTGLQHRDPGVVGASLLNDVRCEIIADNIHVKPDLYELLVKTKKLDDIILITDAMEATNMPDGTYTIGGQSVTVENNVARLDSTGALAGSTLDLNTSIYNFYKNTSLSLPQAIQLASLNPAKVIGVDKERGSLEVGKYADISIFDEDMNCYTTFIEDNLSYKKILTIKDLKNELKNLPDLIVKTSEGLTLDREYGSYRGCYSDLYIELNSQQNKPLTSKELITLLDDALSVGFMEGYKGGIFEIEEDTPVVLSTYGTVSDYYVNNIHCDGQYVILEHIKISNNKYN